jgi:hypothetical protein
MCYVKQRSNWKTSESIMSWKRLFPLLLLSTPFVRFLKYSILLCWEKKLEVRLLEFLEGQVARVHHFLSVFSIFMFFSMFSIF